MAKTELITCWDDLNREILALKGAIYCAKVCWLNGAVIDMDEPCPGLLEQFMEIADNLAQIAEKLQRVSYEEITRMNNTCVQIRRGLEARIAELQVDLNEALLMKKELMSQEKPK